MTEESSLNGIIKENTYTVFLKANIAVAIISISSLAGVMLFPLLKTSFYVHLINLLIGLAFGCMAGDALFHLLPTVLGIHKHGNDKPEVHTHDHSHAHGNEHSFEHLWLMLVILLTIYVLYLFESIFSGSGHSHSHSHDHHHHHHHDNHSAKGTTNPENNMKANRSVINSELSNSSDHFAYTNQNFISDYCAKSRTTSISTASTSSIQVQDHDKRSDSNELSTKENDKNIILCGMNSLALFITFGDALHNLLDGVAIGIAFSSSSSAGISTSIAVFCHELPHEFGDFAVLLSTGMSVKRAAIVNLLSACTCFIGLYFGLLLGKNEIAERWALAVCTGLFLYVALVGMLSELKQRTENIHWTLDLIMKNFGILAGITFMVGLARFEDLLNFT